jgi:hypothetical protein
MMKASARVTMELTFLTFVSQQSATRLKRLILSTKRH